MIGRPDWVPCVSNHPVELRDWKDFPLTPRSRKSATFAGRVASTGWTRASAAGLTPLPDQPIQQVVGGLRQGEEGHQEGLQAWGELPAFAKKRGMVVPDAEVPEPLLAEGQHDQQREEHAGSGFHEGACEALALGFFGAAPPDEDGVGDAVGQHVQGGEGPVAVEGHDAQPPGEGGGADDEGFANRQATFAPPAPGLAEEEEGQEREVEGQGPAGEGLGEGAREIPGNEPGEAAGQVGVPPEQGPEGRGIGGGAIQAAVEGRELRLQALVQGDPTDLLADEMEDREVGEEPPEQPGAEGVERRPAGPRQERNQGVARGVGLELGWVPVGAQPGGVDVGDVNADHERQPQGQRQGFRQSPGPRADPCEPQGQQGAAAEGQEVPGLAE